MKKIIIILILLCASQITVAQINRTLETKVADILAQMPTKNSNHSNALMEEIIALRADGIAQFCSMIVPLGTGDDTQARYVLQTLSTYNAKDQKNRNSNVVETAFLAALQKANDNEVKTFFIQRLMNCGTIASIAPLTTYLASEDLYKPSLATLTTIGTPNAAKNILQAIDNANTAKKVALINALGVLNYASANNALKKHALSTDINIKQKSLLTLAEIATPDAKNTLEEAVKKANYNLDNSKAIIAYIRYGNQLYNKGATTASSSVGKNILKNCTSVSQLHFRTAGLTLLNKIEGQSYLKTLLKEAKHNNAIYTASVLTLASKTLTPDAVNKWVKFYKKAAPHVKPQLIHMLRNRTEATVFENVINEGLNDKNSDIKIAAIKALANQNKAKALPIALKTLKASKNVDEYKAIQETLLRICTSKDNSVLASNLTNANDSEKEVLINVLAARKAKSQVKNILPLLAKGNEQLKTTIYKALPSLVSSDDLSAIIPLLNTATKKEDISNIQKAIRSILDRSNGAYSEDIMAAYANANQKEKLIPVLPSVHTNSSLKLVENALQSSSASVRNSALDALANWKGNNALAILFKQLSSGTDQKTKAIAFNNYLIKLQKSSYPDDQKLLLLRKIMAYSTTLAQQKQVLRNARGIKTFLSLIFVSNYLETENLITTASNTAIRIALPTPGVQNGLSGALVRAIVEKSINNLTGHDSQYLKIDVKEFLDNMPNDKGYVSMFNGKDLDGWKGLVENPIARAKMSTRTLTKKQAVADRNMNKEWIIKDGAIVFVGEGFKNIASVKKYGDFEMIVDWKIGKGGDSGIYLRGTPQVQIWDTALVEVGAQVGSGGLYNNQKHLSKPLKVADNPINNWNTFRIKMIGNIVTVYLNGELVTDHIPLENYWDKNKAIFPKEAIELQAHGEDVRFRNIYVREIPNGDDLLTTTEKKEGFTSLFNGKDLNHWQGNKTDYKVINNEIAVRPKEGGHGNLYTIKEYDNFIFRFEFQLTPGANNGLGIHAPLEGDIAYVGKELQILDNTAAIYKNLKPYQYHASVYGVLTAKRGHLNPVGDWNTEEVIVNGDHIKITLNGIVVLDGNIKEATKNGTLDGKEHSGLQRNNGHIAFLGHGSELQFRNVRIKTLN